MRLGIKMLNSSSTLNDLHYVNQIQVNQGDTADVMFQLVDLDKNYDRYMPADGVTITAKISSHNDANVINKIPTQPFSKDASIFKFSLNTAETKNIGTVNLLVTITEGSNIKSSLANAVIIASPRSPYQC